MRFPSWLAVPFALALAAGCGKGGGSAYKPQEAKAVPKAEVPAGSEQDLLPLSDGATWVYDVESTQAGPQGSQSSKSEVTFRVVSLKEVPGGQSATIHILNAGKKVEEVVWRRTAKGIHELSDVRLKTPDEKKAPIPNDPPLPLVLFPTTAGSMKTVKVTGLRPDGSVGPAEYRVLNEGMQEVDTDMGRMSALAVQNESKFKVGPLDYTFARKTWWAPKKGIVRLLITLRVVNDNGRQATQTSVLRLKSTSP